MKKLALSSTLALFAVSALMLVPRTASASSAIESFKKVRGSITKSVQKGEIQVKAISNKDGEVSTEVTKDGTAMPGFPVDVDVQRKGDELLVHVVLDLDPTSYSTIRFGKKANTLELIRKSDPQRLIRVGLDPKSQSPTTWNQEAILVEGFPIELDENGNIKEPKKTPKKASGGMDVYIKMLIGQTAIAKIQSGS